MIAAESPLSSVLDPHPYPVLIRRVLTHQGDCLNTDYCQGCAGYSPLSLRCVIGNTADVRLTWIKWHVQEIQSSLSEEFLRSIFEYLL